MMNFRPAAAVLRIISHGRYLLVLSCPRVRWTTVLTDASLAEKVTNF